MLKKEGRVHSIAHTGAKSPAHTGPGDPGEQGPHSSPRLVLPTLRSQLWVFIRGWVSLSHRPLASCPTVDRLLGGLIPCRAARLTPGVFPKPWPLSPWSLDSAVSVRQMVWTSSLCSVVREGRLPPWTCYLTPAQLATCEVTLALVGLGTGDTTLWLLTCSTQGNQLRLGTHSAVAPTRAVTVNAVAGMRLSPLDCTPQRVLFKWKSYYCPSSYLFVAYPCCTFLCFPISPVLLATLDCHLFLVILALLFFE